MLDDFKESQTIAYKMIINSIKKNKIAHAYLIETNGFPKKMNFALAFAKYLLCSKHQSNNAECSNCSICHRIDTNNFTELKIIEPDGLWIKKEQLEQLQKEFSKKSIEADKKIYIINGAEKLNLAASNSILKFLEEPEPDIIAILLTDNIYQLLDTIVSRCQIISLKKNEKISFEIDEHQKNSLVFKIATKEVKTEEELKSAIYDEQYKLQIDSAIKFVSEFENKKIEVLVDTNRLWHNVFKDKKQIEFGIDVMILYYKDILNLKMNRKCDVFENTDNDMEKIALKNSVQSITRKIKILLETKKNVKYNANNNLLIDKMIINLGE